MTMAMTVRDRKLTVQRFGRCDRSGGGRKLLLLQACGHRVVGERSARATAKVFVKVTAVRDPQLVLTPRALVAERTLCQHANTGK